MKNYYFIQRKINGEITSYNEGKPGYDKDKFNCIKVNVKKADEDLMKANAKKIRIDNGKLKLKDFNE